MKRNLSTFKKTMFTFLISMVSVSVYSQIVNTGDSLYLYTKSTNEATVYSLDEIKKITFSKKGIQIWNTNWPTEYAYANVSVLAFKDKQLSQTDMESVSMHNVGVDIVYQAMEKMLTVNCSSVIMGVEMYNTMGVMVLSDMKPKRTYRLQLSNLSDGIYIVKVLTDGRAVSKKIVKL